MKKFLLILTMVAGFSAFGQTANKTFKGHTNDVHSVSFSKDGKYLASGSHDTTVVVWDIKKGKEVFTINDHQRAVYAVAFSKLQNNLLATSSSDGELNLWDVEKKTKVANLMTGDIHGNGIVSLAFSPTEDILAVGFMGGEVGLWNARTFAKIGFASERHQGGFTLSVKFSPDGSLLFTSGGLDSSVFMYDVATLTQKQVFFDSESSAPIWDIAIHPNNTDFVTVTSVGALIVWKVGEEKVQKAYRVNNYLALSAEYSKDGSEVYVGVDAYNNKKGNNIKIVDPLTGTIKKEISAHQDRVRGMDLSADGRYLATASWDRTVKIWKIK